MTTANTDAPNTDTPVAQRVAQLEEVADRAVDTARRWLRVAAASDVEDRSASRLAAVLGDRNGVDFAVGFVDRVIRTEDDRAAGAALVDLVEIGRASCRERV